MKLSLAKVLPLRARTTLEVRVTLDSQREATDFWPHELTTATTTTSIDSPTPAASKSCFAETDARDPD